MEKIEIPAQEDGTFCDHFVWLSCCQLSRMSAIMNITSGRVMTAISIVFVNDYNPVRLTTY